MALACTLLAIARGNAVMLIIAIYGLAFGMMLTSVTRLVLVHRQKCGTREVNRLNLLWGVGAFFCPAIANGAVRIFNIPTLLLSVATLLAFLAAVTCLCMEPRMGNQSTLQISHSSSTVVKLPPIVAFYTFIAVGTEATFGAWLATYSHRLGESVFQSVGAITFFWFGLLSSRALAGFSGVRRLSDMTLMYVSFSLASVGALAFLAASRSTTLLPGAFLIGFGLGPIFPTLQAVVLPRIRSNGIFLIGGAASSILPWLTGVTSTTTGSLRTALFIPVALILLLMPCSWMLRRCIIATQEDTQLAAVRI